MRGGAFLQLLDERAVELARERHEPFLLIQLALLAAVELRLRAGRADAGGAALLQFVGELERLVLFEVEFLHAKLQGDGLMRLRSRVLYESTLVRQR